MGLVPRGAAIQPNKGLTLTFGVLVQQFPLSQIRRLGHMIWMGQQAALPHPVVIELINL
jgi:hypothetical protein